MTPLAPLKLTFLVDGQYVVFGDPPSSELRQSLLKVLDFYEVHHEEGPDGALLVPPHVASDHEMIYNYVLKADDPEWLDTHPIEPRTERPFNEGGGKGSPSSY